MGYWSSPTESHISCPGVAADQISGRRTLQRGRQAEGFGLSAERPSPVFGGDEIGVPDRLRSGDLLPERQACFLGYTTGTEMVGAGRFAILT